jgi:hypothetical protein
MKTIRIIAVALGALLISTTVSAFNYETPIDDTIKVKTEDGSEMIIVIDEYEDIENLDAEIDAVMNSLDEVFEELEIQLEGLDSIINISVQNQDREITVDIEAIEDLEEKLINLNFDIDDEPKEERKLHGFMMYELGMNNYLEGGKFPNDVAAQYSVKPWGSWNFAIGGGLRWYIAKPISIDIAGDFSWYNFKYQDKGTRITETADDIIFSTSVSGADHIKSKTTVPYVNVSLTPMVHFGKKNYGVNHRDFRIGAGVYAGYRIGGHVKYEYEQNNTHSVYHRKGNYFLNSYRYGVKAILGYKDFNIYAAYDLSTLYAENKGAELNPISFGVHFTF